MTKIAICVVILKTAVYAISNNVFRSLLNSSHEMDKRAAEMNFHLTKQIVLKYTVHKIVAPPASARFACDVQRETDMEPITPKVHC
jgi:hypothetical protein